MQADGQRADGRPAAEEGEPGSRYPACTWAWCGSCAAQLSSGGHTDSKKTTTAANTTGEGRCLLAFESSCAVLIRSHPALVCAAYFNVYLLCFLQHVQLLTQASMLCSPVEALQSEAHTTKHFLVRVKDCKFKYFIDRIEDDEGVCGTIDRGSCCHLRREPRWAGGQ